ncbi:hypothetical protein F2Q69_00047655 [Brassica cretica]|uniref:Uncharacterized protein n=1 Tax=Brassica cretica TaxID=69181 RepID=A0A8S9PW42_BRACR|nr:hypothetical protein F2Q69_00047655 [Brassica cretica]
MRPQIFLSNPSSLRARSPASPSLSGAFLLVFLRGASGSVGALLQIVGYQSRLWFFWRTGEPSGVGITLGPLGLLLVTDCARSWVIFEIRDSRNTRRFATIAVLAPVSRSSRLLYQVSPRFSVELLLYVE